VLLESLCRGIVLRQNAEKRATRLKMVLDDIETKRQTSMSEKTKEKQELQDAIAAVRNQSRQKISEFRGHVDNKLKVMAWNSHGRLTKTLEHVNELKRELSEAIRDHTEAETNMRHANIKLQNEVQYPITTAEMCALIIK
jgi:polyhydroxyalkanoate synthesis regulator phasin